MAMGKMVRIQSFRRICSGYRPIISGDASLRLFCSGASPSNRVYMLQNEVEKLQHEIDGIRNDIAKVVGKFEMGLAEERRLYLRTVAEDNAKKGFAAKFSHFMGCLIPFGLGGGLAYQLQSRKKKKKNYS